MFTEWVPSPTMSQRLDSEFYRPAYVANERKLEAAAKCCRLADLVDPKAPITNGIRGPELEDTDFRMLRLQDVDGLWINSSSSLRVSERQFHENRRAHCLRGDILLAIGGYIGVVGKVVDSHPQTMGQHSARIRLPENGEVDPDFLLAFFASPEGAMLCQRYVSGGVQAGINLEDVREIRVPLPKPTIQVAIGNKLRKALRLRELARESRNEFAEWLAEAAHANGLSREQLELLNHIPANTSPGSNWTIAFDPADRVDPWPFHTAPRVTRDHLGKTGAKLFSTFFDVVTSNRPRIMPPASPNCYFISVLDVDSNGDIDWNNAEATRYESPGLTVKSGDILYSTLNPQEPRVAVIPSMQSATIACSPEFSIVMLREDAPEVPYLLASILRSLWIRVQASFLTRSSSLSRRRLDEADLWRILLPWSERDIAKLNSLIRSAVTSRRESESLVNAARADVESLIDGILNEERVLEESDHIAAWLVSNPCP